jgi:hypothetical protein
MDGSLIVGASMGFTTMSRSLIVGWCLNGFHHNGRSLIVVASIGLHHNEQITDSWLVPQWVSPQWADH